MNFTPDQLKKAKAAKSVEELIALAKENGLELTEEEAKKYFEQWHKEGELSDDELDNVSGGGCGESKVKYCPDCNSELRMEGFAVTGGNMRFYYLCDSCGCTVISYVK